MRRSEERVLLFLEKKKQKDFLNLQQNKIVRKFSNLL